jgi:hypothetical protein
VVAVVGVGGGGGLCLRPWDGLVGTHNSSGVLFMRGAVCMSTNEQVSEGTS